MFSSFRFLRYLFLRAFPRNFVIGRDADEDAEENDDDDDNDDAENDPPHTYTHIHSYSSFFPRVASRNADSVSVQRFRGMAPTLAHSLLWLKG